MRQPGQRLSGTYETPTGAKFQVAYRPDGMLYVVRLGAPDQKLIPYKGLRFRIPEFADVIIEFVEEGGQITGLRQITPGGVFLSQEGSVSGVADEQSKA